MSFRLKSYGTENPHAFFYLFNDVPTLGSASHLSSLPSHVDKNGIYDDPVFLSTNKTSAKRWFFKFSVGFVATSVPVAYGQVEYILMTSPNGTVYAYGLNDDGSFYLEAFDSKVPKDRRVNFGLAHKGKMAWVPDARQPIPRPEDY